MTTARPPLLLLALASCLPPSLASEASPPPPPGHLAPASLRAAFVALTTLFFLVLMAVCLVLSYVAHHYIHRIHEGVINAMPLEVATSLDMLEKTSDAASEEAIRGLDASIAAKQYTQPALLVEPTIEPEVELDRFEPGESIPFEVWFGMGEPAPMRSRV